MKLTEGFHMPLYHPYLKTLSLFPENQETPISHVPIDKVPAWLFYRRNHFPYPPLSKLSYKLTIGGAVGRSLVISYEELVRLPSRMVTMVLECAGNKRSFFEPKVYGEQWEKGALSQGSWRGVPLATLLELAGGVGPGAREIVAEGQDYGPRKDLPGVYPYARSLPLDKALHPDTILAYELNGLPLPYAHGFPFRLIVPQWYGMASVKWVKQIVVTTEPFQGPFQVVDYVYESAEEKEEPAVQAQAAAPLLHPPGHSMNPNPATSYSVPVTTIQVNSSILQPTDREVLASGHHTIRGIAWSGEGTIVKVEVSTDGGDSWAEAYLAPSVMGSSYEWTRWFYDWFVYKPGEYTLLSRAIDSAGRIQPSAAYWNRKGYGYNAIDRVTVKVE